MSEIRFLTLDEVLAIHLAQLDRYGGKEGTIDCGVVESAAAQARASMFGEYLHRDIAHMAAAYLFHFAASQGFEDGNKRTAWNCAVTFLALNGYTIEPPEDERYDVVMRVANHAMTKEELWAWIAEHVAPLD